MFAILLAVASCRGGSSGGGEGGGSSGGTDRSSLPVDAPTFEISPMEFPNDLETDLSSLGIYNITSDCDATHYGWDFTPNWDSYADDLVPIVAVADGFISNMMLRNTNPYEGQDVDAFTVVLAVAREVDIHYTFEPFITFEESESLQWLEVELNDRVSAGDVIGFLPRIEGNLGDHLIHIDWKVGTGSTLDDYVCPTPYFGTSWIQGNLSVLLAKIGSCPSLCCE